MSTLVLDSCQVYVDGVDLTGYSNTLQLNGGTGEVDKTTFGSGGWREFAAGLLMANGSVSGFASYDDTEPANVLFGKFRSTEVVTFGVDDSDGAAAFALQGFQTQFTPVQGSFGAMAEYQLGIRGSGKVGYGVMALEKQYVSGDTNNTSFEFSGGIAADQTLAMAVHCFSAGTTIDVNVESDVDANFNSPTEQLTTTVTAVGGTWVTTSGAITDTHFRVTTDTATGTFSLAVAVVRI